jgi:GNAT superfamily N-acetyltransferase
VSRLQGVRRADRRDLDDLARMAGEGIAEQLDERGGRLWARRETRPAPFGASFEASLDDDCQEVWVGTFAGVTVGYAAAHVEELRDGTLLAVVDDLYVEPDARRVGVGESLMTAVTDWACSRSCAGVDGWALPGNRETKNFFESFGFTARGIVVHHPLEQR